ncbi:hypothetical protein MSIMFB_01077 [Mycobacterium simulans]|uniref:Uncharacterized protein n=1 Tax=Mycobacterium simulans TaxID=627089 RepID=A0A7Z7N8D4_9MYCO|nr:hypothetical protein [Mycobacterium simulans]SOJ53576.1 hypothetical protein MSIMFB_01077 [Mycobacterium simulans]
MTIDVNMGEWLTALSRVPVIDTDLQVAFAWAQSGNCAGARDLASERFGIDRERFDDSTDELIGLGFFDDVLHLDHGECVERILEFRMPSGVTA